MKKIQSLFQRNYETDRLVRNEVVPCSEWVMDGEGIATRKWDGTCCLIQDGQFYRRLDVKNGKTPPKGFIPAQEPDVITGHCPGWILCDRSSNENKYYFEAYDKQASWENGTYELCGERINGNPEHIIGHVLIRHGKEIIDDAPRTYEKLKNMV